MNKIKNGSLAIVVSIIVFLGLLNSTSATQQDKIDWCHCEPNGNCQTLSLPFQALENAGHVSANGNPLHAGDHYGACTNTTPETTPTWMPTPTWIPTPTSAPIPTNVPTPTDSDNETDITPTPTGGNIIDGNIFDICIPISNNCPTPTQTPTPTTEPTATPKPTDAPTGGGSNNDNNNNSSSSQSSSSSSSSTGGGEVLGATTLAKTGVFDEIIANLAMFSGSLLMGTGLMYGKKNS